MTIAENHELDLHKEIYVSNKRRCCLFIIHSMRGFLRNCCWNCISDKYSQLLFLKDTVRKRVTEDLDIVDIIKRFRELQVIVDNSKIDDSIRYKIKHSYNHTINLENHNNEDKDDPMKKLNIIHDEDREDPQIVKKRYDDMFKFGNSPFPCQCISANRIDGKMTGAFNFNGTSIGPKNQMEDYIRFKLTCKMFEYVRKMQKRVDARKGKNISQLREQKEYQRESFIAQSHLGSKSNIGGSDVESIHTESGMEPKRSRPKRNDADRTRDQMQPFGSQL